MTPMPNGHSSDIRPIEVFPEVGSGYAGHVEYPDEYGRSATEDRLHAASRLRGLVPTWVFLQC